MFELTKQKRHNQGWRLYSLVTDRHFFREKTTEIIPTTMAMSSSWVIEWQPIILIIVWMRWMHNVSICLNTTVVYNNYITESPGGYWQVPRKITLGSTEFESESAMRINWRWHRQTFVTLNQSVNMVVAMFQNIGMLLHDMLATSVELRAAVSYQRR